MPWVKLDDHFPDHPKIAAAGPLAMAWHVAAICYCARYLTDGFIPTRAARSLLDLTGCAEVDGYTGDDVEPDTLIARLVRSGAWHEVEGGYEVHDYLVYNPSREQVEAERKKAADRMAKGRRSGKRSGGSSGERSGEVQGNTGSSSAVPYPYPSTTNAHEFDEFWTLYPRKVGKDKARKAWANATERAAPAEITAGLRRQVEAHPLMGADEVKYVPHPTSWLNAGRWADEVAKPAPTRKVIGIVNVNGVQMQGLVDAS